MKKFILISLILFNISNLKGKTFEDIANNLIDNSYIKEVNILKKEKIGKNLLDFNNLSFSTSLGTSDEDKNNNKKNNLILNANIKYSILTYNLSYDLINKDNFNHSISLSKNLNSLMYNVFKENNINYRLKLRELNNKYENDFINKMNLIKKYLLLKYENDMLKIEIEDLENEIKILDSKKKNGTISDFEYDVFKDTISILKDKLSLKELSLNDVILNLKINNIDTSLVNSLLEIEKIKIDDDILNKYIDYKILNFEILNLEKIKMEKNKNIVSLIPQININFNYNISKNSYLASLSLSKDFDIINNDFNNIALQKEIINKKEKELLYLKEKKESELKLEIKKYELEIKENELKVKNLEREVLILNKKYELGLDSLKKLYDKKNELMKSKLELNTKTIDYEIFKFIIKRGVR